MEQNIVPSNGDDDRVIAVIGSIGMALTQQLTPTIAGMILLSLVAGLVALYMRSRS